MCDSGHNKLLRLDWRDGSVAPYAGSGKRGHRDGGGAAAAFDSPAGVCVCSDGVVLVADTNNHCVRSVSCDGGGGGRLVVRTVAGSGERGHRDALASGAKFDRPAAVAASSTSEGLIYVSDSGNHCVRVLSAAAEGGIVGTLAGTAGTAGHRDGPLAQSLLASPAGLALLADGRLAVADAGNHCVRRIDFAAQEAYTLGGSTARRWGCRDGAARAALFAAPRALAVGRAGELWVADCDNRLVRLVRRAASGLAAHHLLGAPNPVYAAAGLAAAALGEPRLADSPVKMIVGHGSGVVARPPRRQRRTRPPERRSLLRGRGAAVYSGGARRRRGGGRVAIRRRRVGEPRRRRLSEMRRAPPRLP